MVSAAIALFGWTAYEPANVVAAFQLRDVASEAVVVVIALGMAGLAAASGCALLFTRLGISATPRKT